MLIPVEHVLLVVQIIIGLRLIFSLKAWLRQLEREAGESARAPAYAKAGKSPGAADARPVAAASARASDASGAAADRVHEAADLCLPGPPHEWLTRPVMLRVATGSNAGQQVEFNLPSSVFPVDTELFEGRMYFRLRGCAHEPRDYFFGKQRRLSAVVQGRFKERLVMGECYTGYEFRAPFQHVRRGLYPSA